jgi:hypothetical protein
MPTVFDSLNARLRHARRSGRVEIVGMIVEDGIGDDEVDMLRDSVLESSLPILMI